MKSIILLLTIVATGLFIFACSSCPVPPDAPRTYSLTTVPGGTPQK